MKYSKFKSKMFYVSIVLVACLIFIGFVFANTGINQDDVVDSVTSVTWFTKMRDTPRQVTPGSTIDVRIDSQYRGFEHKVNTTTLLEIPTDATFDMTYEWNGEIQKVNDFGSVLARKDVSSDIPSSHPRAYAYVSDGWNSSVEDVQSHLSVFEEKGLTMTANVAAGALYYDTWDPALTAFYGYNLAEYMKRRKYDIGSNTYHQSHLGSCSHIKDTGERRDASWGIANTEQEMKMEVLLGKYWNEIYFNRRMEGFRSPFHEFHYDDAASLTPLMSKLNGVLYNAGMRYCSHVTEAASGFPRLEVGKTPLAGLQPLTVVPSWPQFCDVVTASLDPATALYTNAMGDWLEDTSYPNILNSSIGAQYINDGGQWRYSRIVDTELSQFGYDTMMNFLKKYTDRHYTVVQDEVPVGYLTGDPGVAPASIPQDNIPLMFSVHPSQTNGRIVNGKANNEWVYEIEEYIKTNYPDAVNTTQKGINNYMDSFGSYEWVVKMPEKQGRYRIVCFPPCGCVDTYFVNVTEPVNIYNDQVTAKTTFIKSAGEIAAKKAKGFNGVIFTVKDETGQPKISELQQIITVAKANLMDVYCNIKVFKDADMHTTVTLDHTGGAVANIAEPIDVQYREALKQLIGTLGGMEIKGILLDAELPTNSSDAPTYGYSDAMVNHFNKYFGPPPAGTNPQDPTSENDPLHWSIYAATTYNNGGHGDLGWYNYDIRSLVNTYITTGDVANLAADQNGTYIVDWLLSGDSAGIAANGISSWDEIEAWGEFRRYMLADFITEIAGGTATVPVYAMVKGEQDGHALLNNALFGTNSDPVELADPLRRPSILPDKWNQPKTETLAGIIYDVKAPTVESIKQYAEMGRRVDYYVAKGGNSQLNLEPFEPVNTLPYNNYRPLEDHDKKIYGLCLRADEVTDEMKLATASVNGTVPAMIIVDEKSSEPPVVSISKPIYSSSQFAPEFPPENANDGNPNTIWGGALDDQKPLIYIDLGKPYLLDKISISWFGKYYASKYNIGVIINGKVVMAPMNGDGGDDVISVGQYNVRSRFVGIECLEGPGGGYGISELTISGTE